MSYNAELQMLREFFLHQGMELKCCFCQQPLLYPFSAPSTFGHRRHTKVRAKITLHHRDENRSNNRWDNLVWSHSDCHKRYHAMKGGQHGQEREERQEEGQEGHVVKEVIR